MKRVAAGGLTAWMLLVLALGPGHGAPPKGWGLIGGVSPSVEVGVDRTIAHGGKASAYLKAAADDGFRFGILRQWVRAVRYRGKRVRLSAYLKTQNVGTTRRSGARLDFLVFDKAHRYGGPPMRGRLIQGTTDWTRYERVVDVPQQTVLLFIGIVLTGSGQVWADDIQLQVVGKDVSVTSSTDRKTALSDEMKMRVQKRLGTAGRRPVNVDFEH
jgi:hypothetical protein